MSMTENPKVLVIGDDRSAGKMLKAQLELLEELEAYRAIGTVSECRELKEKATAKKPIDTFKFSPCPKCGSKESLGDGFCYNCGTERGL